MIQCAPPIPNVHASCWMGGGGCIGFQLQGSGFKVRASGCRVQGSGCRVQGSGFRVQDSGLGEQKGTCGMVLSSAHASPPSERKVSTSSRILPVAMPAAISERRSGVSGSTEQCQNRDSCPPVPASGSGFRVQGSESRVQSAGFRVQGSAFRDQGFEVMVYRV